VDPAPRRVNARVFEPKQTTRVGSLARVEVNPPTSSRRLKNASSRFWIRGVPTVRRGESRAYRAGRAAGARRRHRERRDTRPIRPRRAAMPSIAAERASGADTTTLGSREALLPLLKTSENSMTTFERFGSFR